MNLKLKTCAAAAALAAAALCATPAAAQGEIGRAHV